MSLVVHPAMYLPYRAEDRLAGLRGAHWGTGAGRLKPRGKAAPPRQPPRPRGKARDRGTSAAPGQDGQVAGVTPEPRPRLRAGCPVVPTQENLVLADWRICGDRVEIPSCHRQTKAATSPEVTKAPRSSITACTAQRTSSTTSGQGR